MEMRTEGTERSYKPRATLADFLSTKASEGKYTEREDFSDLPDDVNARCLEAHGWVD